MDFHQASERYLTWLSDHSLPRLATAGRDPLGGYYEALNLDGTPITGAPKRLRVQARQAFSFARADALGLMPDGRAASDEAFRFMIEAGFSDASDGYPAGWVHILGPDGAPQDSRRDTYDHAFVLLAAAERWRVYQDPHAKDVAQRIGAYLDTAQHAERGFEEGFPATLPRRQNPHMHLLEASLLCRHAGLFDRASTLIADVISLFDDVFWDREAGVLREFFADDWAPAPESFDVIEPGHMAEWIWLLAEAGYEDLDLLKTMLTEARRYGELEGPALLCSSANAETLEKSDGCRLWPQTENIRASLVMARLTGEEHWYEDATRYLDALQSIFLSGAAPGCYHDNVDHGGTVLSDRTPASTLYHHITLADEILRHRRD